MNRKLDHPPSVILVDDDQALLRALRFSLELEGFHVDAHDTGTSVVASALPQENACLVIDYLLPDLTVLELLTQLRDDGVRLPAVLITSHPGSAFRNAALTLDAGIVEKPLLGPHLVAEIRARLSPSTIHPERPQ